MTCACVYVCVFVCVFVGEHPILHRNSITCVCCTDNWSQGQRKQTFNMETGFLNVSEQMEFFSVPLNV